jgi:hypothetical protein
MQREEKKKTWAWTYTNKGNCEVALGKGRVL